MHVYAVLKSKARHARAPREDDPCSVSDLSTGIHRCCAFYKLSPGATHKHRPPMEGNAPNWEEQGKESFSPNGVIPNLKTG